MNRAPTKTMNHYNPNIHHRRSIRLREWDYAQPAVYFITICLRQRVCLFGEIVEGRMLPNQIGQIIETEWSGLPNRFFNVGLDEFIVMPNHIHGIIFIKPVETSFVAPESILHSVIQGAMNRAPTLGEVVRSFKAASARIVRKRGFSEFTWQHNYYEHIIRNERELDLVRGYLLMNPIKWSEDDENPDQQALCR